MKTIFGVNSMKKINSYIEKNIYNIIIIYLFIQPFLDVIAGISINILNINNFISPLIRLVFLFFSIYYLYFISKNKSFKIITSLIIIYILIFSINIIYIKDFSVLSYELKNTLNTFYFPIVLMLFTDALKNKTFDLKKIYYIYSIYLLLIFIPGILNIGFDSYAHSKVGTIGFFISANSIGNILSILFPLVLIYRKDRNRIVNLILLLITLYVFFSMGTKVPILSLFIILLILFIYIIVKLAKNKNYKKLSAIFSIIVLVIFMTILIVPKTNFYKNIKIHLDFLEVSNPVFIFSDVKLIDHFIFSQRLTFLNNSYNSYKESNLMTKIIGIGYIENYSKDNLSLKMIEMDYFDILLRHGIIGFILFFIPVIYALKNNTFKFDLNNIMINTSIFLIFILALFSGHLFITPSTSIFIPVIFNLKNSNKI